MGWGGLGGSWDTSTFGSLVIHYVAYGLGTDRGWCTSVTSMVDEPTNSDPTWTPRQREVLDLVAAGHTNTEIAQRLGITLAGAKWHVSELISRLGVDSRDDVADYWRRERRLAARLRRTIRHAIGLLSLKAVAVGAAATLGVSAAVAGIVFTGNGDADRIRTDGSTAVPTSTVVGAPPDVEAAYVAAAEAMADCMREGGTDVAVFRDPQGGFGFDYGPRKPSPGLASDCYQTHLANAERNWQQNNPALEQSSIALGHEVMRCYLNRNPGYVFPDDQHVLIATIADLDATSTDFQECFVSTMQSFLAAVGQGQGGVSIAYTPFEP